jgi:hypothetical protein
LATSSTPDGNRALDRLTEQAGAVMQRLAATPARTLEDLAIKVAAVDRDTEQGRVIMDPGVWTSIARDMAALAGPSRITAAERPLAVDAVMVLA